MASQNGHTEVIKLLHEHGSQVDVQNNDELSTNENGHFEIINLLHEYEPGAQVALTSNHQEKPNKKMGDEKECSASDGCALNVGSDVVRADISTTKVYHGAVDVCSNQQLVSKSELPMELPNICSQKQGVYDKETNDSKTHQKIHEAELAASNINLTNKPRSRSVCIALLSTLAIAVVCTFVLVSVVVIFLRESGRQCQLGKLGILIFSPLKPCYLLRFHETQMQVFQAQDPLWTHFSS